MNLGNCPKCGRLYALNFQEMCPECLKNVELEYQECHQFLRETKGATIHEVSEATGVSIKQITKFIREGRISVADAPNLSYPCEVCGTLIRENKMCESCRTRLTKELRNVTSDEQSRNEDVNKQESQTYKAFDKMRKY